MKAARMFDPRKEYVFRKRLFAQSNKDFDKYQFANKLDSKKVEVSSYYFGMCEGYIVVCHWCEEVDE